MLLNLWIFGILFALFFLEIKTSFTENFRNFLRKNYGEAVERELTRLDLGVSGSFGGGTVHPAGAKTTYFF